MIKIIGLMQQKQNLTWNNYILYIYVYMYSIIILNMIYIVSKNVV